METTVHLTTETVPLAALLKLAGVAGSGGQAKHLVQDGHVLLNGRVENRRGTKVRPGDVVDVDVAADEPIRITVA